MNLLVLNIFLSSQTDLISYIFGINKSKKNQILSDNRFHEITMVDKKKLCGYQYIFYADFQYASKYFLSDRDKHFNFLKISC